MQRVIIDTGPLVAWFDAADPHHASALGFLAAFEGQLLSTWPVLTEVCHLLPERLVPDFLRWVARGGVTVIDVPSSTVAALADRMDKYADLPMDLADASLVWVAESALITALLVSALSPAPELSAAAAGHAIAKALGSARHDRRRCT